MPEKLHVLVIDDNPVDIEIIRRYLEDIHNAAKTGSGWNQSRERAHISSSV